MVSRRSLLLGLCVGALLLLAGMAQAGEQGYWELTKEPEITQRSAEMWHPIPELDGRVDSADVNHVAYSWRSKRPPKPWTSHTFEWDRLPGILRPGEILPARVKYVGGSDRYEHSVGLRWGNERVAFLKKPGEDRNKTFVVPWGVKGMTIQPYFNAGYFAVGGSHVVTYTYAWKQGAPPAVPPPGPAADLAGTWQHKATGETWTFTPLGGGRYAAAEKRGIARGTAVVTGNKMTMDIASQDGKVTVKYEVTIAADGRSATVIARYSTGQSGTCTWERAGR